MKKKIFFRQLKIEGRKAMCNKMFFFTLLIAVVFSILAAVYQISRYYALQANTFSGNSMVRMCSLYNSWIGNDGSSLGSICFFYLFPLLAAFPYGWGYLMEKNQVM